MARLLLIASLVGARGAAGLGAAPADSSMIQFGTAVDKSNTSQQTTITTNAPLFACDFDDASNLGKNTAGTTSTGLDTFYGSHTQSTGKNSVGAISFESFSGAAEFSIGTAGDTFSMLLWMDMRAHNPFRAGRSYLIDLRPHGQGALYFDSDNTVKFSGMYGNCQGSRALGERSLAYPHAFNTWVHFAIVSDPTGTRLFKDGELLYEALASSCGTSYSTALVDKAVLGTYYSSVGSSGSYFMDASIDDLQFYRSALSAQDVNDVYAATPAICGSSSGPSWKPVGPSWRPTASIPAISYPMVSCVGVTSVALVCMSGLLVFLSVAWRGPVVRLSSALVFGQSSMINVSGHAGSTIVKSRRNAAAAKHCKSLPCIPSLKVSSRSSKLQIMGQAKGGATVSTQIMFNFLNITKTALDFNGWIHEYRGRVFNQDADHEEYRCSECGLNGLKCLQIVRNPLDRVVSSYIHTMSSKIHTFIEREIADFAADASFAEFIAFLKRTAATRSRYWQDMHYLPQCDNVCKHTEFDRVQHLPLESLDAGLAWFGQTENIQGLTRNNMSSHHYVKKSPRVDPGAAYLRYSKHLHDSPPSYESFLAEPSIFKDLCCLFRADIELYRMSCSSEWLQGCAECVDSCARELRRLAPCD